MQEIIVKEVRGPLGKGKQQFYAVVDEKGAEFTTFDTKIKTVTAGSRLGIDVKVDGKYVNITDWEVLEEGRGSAAVSSNGAGKSPEQFEAERRSIESQVAFKGMVQLMAEDKPDLVPADVKKLVFDWAKAKLELTHVVKPAQAASTAKSETKAEPEELFPEKPEDVKKPGKFENPGQFLSACLKELKFNRSDVESKLEVKSMEELLQKYGSYEKAFLKLAEKSAGMQK